MKVLFLYSYFKPEHTSGAHLAEDLRQGLASKGHIMEVYAPFPSRGVSEEERKIYKKKKNESDLNGAVKIHRFWLFREGKNSLLRAIRYSILEMQLLFWGMISKDVNILPLGSTPPINGIVGIILKKIKGIPYVYNVQDIFPDSLVNTGMTHEGAFLWRIGEWVSKITYKNAAHIVVISENMRKKLEKKGVPSEKISVIYNWIDTDKVHPINRIDNPLFDELGINRESFIVTYAGNLGNSQNVGILVECAEKLKYENGIQFIVFGDGSEKESLVADIADRELTNIKVFPMMPIDRVSEVYSMGDASMVISKKGVGGSAFPSKAASIMATGTPIIASFDINSDLCRMIKKENVGLCADAEDVQATVEAIRELYSNRELCMIYGEKGRKIANTRFSKVEGVKKRIEILEKSRK